MDAPGRLGKILVGMSRALGEGRFYHPLSLGMAIDIFSPSHGEIRKLRINPG